MGSISGYHQWQKNWVKPNSSAVSNNFILCYHSSLFDNSSVLTKEKKTLVSESKESLLAMRDKPFWNRSTRSLSAIVPFQKNTV